jgi:SAM-dependent methyltransferase
MALDRLVPRPAVLGPIGKSDVVTLARHKEMQAREILELFNPRPELSGKTLLDLGCGLGGKTAYYATQRPRCVVGLEISPLRAVAAHRYICQRGFDGTAHIVIGDASRLPFRREAFDLTLATDTWEHLKNPEQTLAECGRITKIRCAIWICFMPYYSPWGAHAWDWVGIPWLQVWLPRRWLWGVIREVDHLRRVNAQRAKPVRVDWTNEEDPAHARRLTIARFEKSVEEWDGRIEQLGTLPIGFASPRPVARLISRLAVLPGLRELLTGLVVCVLRAEQRESG